MEYEFFTTYEDAEAFRATKAAAGYKTYTLPLRHDCIEVRYWR